MHEGEAVVAYFTCYFGLRLGQLGTCLDAQYLAEIRTGHPWHYGSALEVKTNEERSHCLKGLAGPLTLPTLFNNCNALCYSLLYLCLLSIVTVVRSSTDLSQTDMLLLHIPEVLSSHLPHTGYND